MAALRAKVAVSVDAALLARVEKLRAKTGESRSAVVARALARLMDEAAHAERVQRYVAAYRELPETADVVDRATDLAARALRDVPWSDE